MLFSVVVLSAHAVTSAEGGDLSWCVLCSLHEPAQPPSDQTRILGTWRIIGSIGSEEVPKEALGTEIEFTADFMILKPKNADGPGDWIKKPIVQLGIYRLENDKLRFGLASAGQPRPDDFRGIPQAFLLEFVEEP
jgi:hypothetical protein